MESADPHTTSAGRRAFPPELESIGLARDFVNDVLAETGVEPSIDPALVRDVQLVASELVTNAVTHGSGPAVVVVGHTSAKVHCSVTSESSDDGPTSDDGPIRLAADAPPTWSRSGRGLAIVKAVADSVDVTVARSSWTIACDFDRR